MKKIILCTMVTAALLVPEHDRISQMAQWLHVQCQAFTEGKTAGDGTEDIRADHIFSETVYPSDLTEATLYFGFLDTGYLGAQRMLLDIRREETAASRIVQALVDGPDETHDDLRGLFPQGTQVIAVSGEGTTVFVTLNRSFLGRPAGAPMDWEDDPAWEKEAERRRRLALQSMVLSLTEDGRYQRVQLYIADTDDEVPVRPSMLYFDARPEHADTVLGPCARDESVLLTPSAAVSLIMEAWKQREWETLHALLLPQDLPVLGEFEAIMKDADVTLVNCEAAQGNVSLDGKRATVVVEGRIQTADGEQTTIHRESIPMLRYEDNWCMQMDTLMSLMIRE